LALPFSHIAVFDPFLNAYLTSGILLGWSIWVVPRNLDERERGRTLRLGASTSVSVTWKTAILGF
jgi:hypothetical protein